MQFAKRKGSARHWLAAAVLTPTLVMSGCFFDDDDDDNRGGNGGSTSTAAGKAYDGYLVGALVCVDLNLNKGCDSDEPNATTGAGGTLKSRTSLTSGKIPAGVRSGAWHHR